MRSRRPPVERPWLYTQVGTLTRFGLAILGWIYDRQHRRRGND